MNVSQFKLFSRLSNVLMLGLILLGNPLCASEPAGKAKVLRFGVITIEEAPLLYIKDHSKHQGFVIDLVMALGRELGSEIKVISIPRKGLEQAILSGKIDFSWLAPQWTENRDRLIFSETFLVHRAFLYSLTAFSNSNDPVDWLKGKSICLRQDYAYPSLAPLILNKTVQAANVSNDAPLFTLLAKGRCDLIHVNEYLAITSAYHQLGDQQVFRTPEPIEQANVGFMFDKNRYNDIGIFNKALAKLKKSGVITAILERNVSQSITEQ